MSPFPLLYTNNSTSYTKEMSDNTKQCHYCKLTIEQDATVCQHCSKAQNRVIEGIKQTSAVVTIFMVIIALAQVIFAYLQMQESRKKRIEATEVLLESKRVLNVTENRATQISKEAEETLENAKIESKAAVDNSKIVLSKAEFDVVTAMIAVKEVERKASEVMSKLNQQIENVERSLNSFQSDSSKTLVSLEKELSFLTSRNNITKLGDDAISTGNAEAYSTLHRMHEQCGDSVKKENSNNQNSCKAILSEILRIKGHFASGTSILKANLTWKNNNKVYTESEIPTEILVVGVGNTNNWRDCHHRPKVNPPAN